MIECVAVIGRMIIDRMFHQELFSFTDYTKEYKDLGGLVSFLNETHGLRLSRWEVMTINTLVRQEILHIIGNDGEVIEIRPQHFLKAKDDGVVNGMQDAWSKVTFPMTIDFKSREHVEFCAALGLACIDYVFCSNLVAATNIDPVKTETLQIFLTTKDPRFIPPVDLRAMNQFLQFTAVPAGMKAFYGERWVQPKSNPCDLGYTYDPVRDFNFLAQAEIELLLGQSEPVRDALKALREKNKGNVAPSL